MTTDPDQLAEAFTQARPRLVRVAYAIIGTHTEAEDVVADCWFRLVSADQQDPVRDVEAWSVVAVSRMALDVLRSARVRRERYVGPWLPEPVIASPDATTPAAPPDPADQVTLADEVNYALLVVMETLSPAERTAFVLHDLFGLTFTEVANIVGRTPGAVRQLALRARHHVRTRSPWPETDATEHQRVIEAFAKAATSGNLAALIHILDPDVVLVSDGGGLVRSARKPVYGPDHVARFLLGVLAKEQPGDKITRVLVNGAPGFAVYQQGIVADSWFRLLAADEQEPIHDVEACSVVTVSRMALDVLRSARVRREHCVGPWLPEPVIASATDTTADPADQVTLADEVSYAILVVMETLSQPNAPRSSPPAPSATLVTIVAVGHITRLDLVRAPPNSLATERE